MAKLSKRNLNKHHWFFKWLFKNMSSVLITALWLGVVYTYRQSLRFLYRLKMGSMQPYALRQKDQRCRSQNRDADYTYKRAFKDRLWFPLVCVYFRGSLSWTVWARRLRYSTHLRTERWITCCSRTGCSRRNDKQRKHRDEATNRGTNNVMKQGTTVQCTFIKCN